MTLRELLKDRALPIQLHFDEGLNFFEVRYIHNEKAYGHDATGRPVYHRLDDTEMDWSLALPPKPRLLAWRSKETERVFLSSQDFSADCGMERCPWLDEKREGDG